MARFVYDPKSDRMVDKDTGEPMVDPSAPFKPATPKVFGDLPGYQSPIDGRWIEGRRARRYDLESNDCIDANDLPSLTKGKARPLKNRRFAEKHNALHLLEEGN